MRVRILAAACAIAILAADYAGAQNPPAPASPQGTGPGGTTDGNRPASAASPVGVASFLSRQTSDQWLASALLGKSVHGVDGQPVGEVKDLVLDRRGSVAAFVVDVGAFLGSAGKIVAIPFGSVQVSRDANNNDRLVLQATRTDLQNAPAFVSARDADGTMGAGAPGAAGTSKGD